MFITSLQNSKTLCEQKNYCTLLKFKMKYVPSGIFSPTFSNPFLVHAPFLYRQVKKFLLECIPRGKKDIDQRQIRGELNKLRFIYQSFFIWRNTGMAFVLKYGFQCWGRDVLHKLVSFMYSCIAWSFKRKKTRNH